MGVLTTISTCKRTIPNEHIIRLNPVVHSFRSTICGPGGLCHLTEPVLDASMMDCMVAWEALVPSPKQLNPPTLILSVQSAKCFSEVCIWPLLFLPFFPGAQKDLQPTRGEFRMTYSGGTSCFVLLCPRQSSCSLNICSPFTASTAASSQ